MNENKRGSYSSNSKSSDVSGSGGRDAPKSQKNLGPSFVGPSPKGNDKGKGKAREKQPKKSTKGGGSGAVNKALLDALLQERGNADAARMMAREKQEPKEKTYREQLDDLISKQVFDAKTTTARGFRRAPEPRTLFQNIRHWWNGGDPESPPISMPGYTISRDAGQYIKICDYKTNWVLILQKILGTVGGTFLLYKMITGVIWRWIHKYTALMLAFASMPPAFMINWYTDLIWALLYKTVGKVAGLPITHFVLKWLVGFSYGYIMTNLAISLARSCLDIPRMILQSGLHAISTKDTLVLEVEDVEVVDPDLVPSMDEETYQAHRSILICQPRIKYDTFVGPLAVDLHFNDPNLQHFYFDGSPVVANMRKFNISLKLLPELLNQKTLLANMKPDPTQEINRLLRLAESCGNAQDNFYQFLEGRDVYRDTVLFGMMRILNKPDVSLSLN